MPGTRPRNGLPLGDGYVYRGSGRDEDEAREARSRRRQQDGLPDRILAALRALGGEASTPEIRARVELDGAPPFHPGYFLQVLMRLSRRDPPAVTAAGREESGSGRPVRWRLGPGGGDGS